MPESSTIIKDGIKKSAKIATDPVVAELWQKVLDFSLDAAGAVEPYSQVLMDEMKWDRDFSELVILEYKKFMFLCRLFADNMTPSVHVDTAWHLHLLYTRNYQRFCREALDSEFIHHEPSSGGSLQEEFQINWYAETLSCYMDVFGNVPPVEIWGQRVRTDKIFTVQ